MSARWLASITPTRADAVLARPESACADAADADLVTARPARAKVEPTRRADAGLKCTRGQT